MGTIAQLFESGEQASDKGLFNNLVMLTRVDGKVDDAEVALLARIAKRLSLTEEQVNEIIHNPESYPMIPPFSKEERYERLIEFVEMMYVDGDIDPREEKLVAKYGIALGFSDEAVNDISEVIISKIKEGMDMDEILDSII